MLEVQPCVVYEDILSKGIMQTEDASAKEVDEISNRLIEELEPDMTVKEEVEEPQPIVCECSPSSILPEECLAPDSLEVQEQSFCESEEFVHNSLRPECTAALAPCPTPHCLDELVSFAGGQDDASPLASFSLPDQQKGDRGRSRGRRRSRWKLKFHHQALPPEYLDHYEAAMAQQDAAAKSTPAIKPEAKPRTANSTTKALPPLVPRSVMTEKKFDNLVHLIKKEQDAGKLGPLQPPLLRNLCPADQLQFMPISTVSVGSENELLSRLQQDFQRCRTEDISVVTEKMTVNDKKTSASDNILQGKGLLGSLLSSNVSPEISIKACSDASKKKRSSVIMTNCTSTNLRTTTPVATAAQTSSRVMKYQDLPYMGEITLDNTKPRRGRKPKKADICHLIYKNYGTIFPGAPNQNATAESADSLKMKAQGAAFPSTCNTNSKTNKKDGPLSTGIKCRPLDSLKSSPPINHADVQNRIISSLLEKRLTAASMDAKRNALNLESSIFRQAQTESVSTANNMREPWLNNKHITPPSAGTDEPLNLCIKDLNQLKIRLLRKHGNFYEPRSNNNIVVKSEPNSPSEVEQIELRDSPKETMSKFSDDAESTGTCSSRNQTPLSSRQLDHENSLPFPPINIPTQFSNPPILPTDAMNQITSGYVYWPNAGVFVHPMALQSQLLYYQKMGAIPLLPVPPVEPSPAFIPSPIAPNTLIPNLPAMMAAQRNNDGNTKDHQRPTASCIKRSLPKGFSSILHTKPPEMPSELSFPRMKRLAPLGNLPQPGSTSTTKRKRSAIFIPPMPSENNNNPTTEVSICKFKFTGGAKPSLQEKKMLSVDSGGNFRYYSGTGDKSMRGYEFFPRESLQPSSGTNNATPSENFFAASAMGSCESISPNNQHLGTPSTFTEKAKTNFPASDVRLGNQMYIPGFTEGILDTLQSDTIMKQTETGENQLAHLNIGVDFNKKLSVGREPDSYAASKADGSCGSQFKARRKRKTRKSLAREKLEQTFKEKGFLIQTQQLESAEGATYCKFRQLRKFTRYLFRSWKDYLPGNVREMSVAAGVGGSGTTTLQRDVEAEGELSSNSPHSNQETTEVVQQPSAE